MFLVANRLALLMVCFLGLTSGVSAADSLLWNTNKARVTADVQTWDLQALLEHIATATGWEIYVEPKARHRASTKFKERPPGEALRLLLGNLSYALVPQTNGPGKLYVFRNAMGDATQLVKARKKAKKLDKELIVTMKPGSKLDEKKFGGKIKGKIDKLNTYRVEFDSAEAAEEARRLLEQDENVDLVDSNYEILRPSDPESLSLSSIPGMDLKIQPNALADGPIIGLIDTAVQMSGGARDGFYLPQVSVGDEASLTGEWPTHGTSMAEAILRGLGMLKDGGDVSGVRILPVDVYGDSASTTSFQLIQGVLQALKEGANVVNMSLGSPGGNALLHRIIQEASAKGVLFFGAAGNEPTTAPTYPAAYPEVIAVTAMDRNGTIANYANFGDFVDMGAPGTVIVPFNGRSYVTMGTSPATALASGLGTSLLVSGVPPETISGKLGSILAPPKPPPTPK